MSSRIEELMSALVNGETAEVVPQSRMEEYLLALLKGETEVKEPKSRIEAYLYQLCKQGMSGGGSSGGITPTGTIEITENGTHDVTNYASANVNVASSGGGDLDAFLNGDIEELISDIEIISAYCCYSKDELISVNFPNATRIQMNAFNNCTKLKNVNIPNAINALDNSFTKCSSLESLILPKVTSIGYSAFTYCEKLKYIDLPSAKSIGNYAFNNCYSLKAVVLRANTLCTSSMGGVFNSCYHILGTAYPTHNPNGDKDGYIYVPRALLSDDDATKDYRRATNWTVYASQFRALEDWTVDGTVTGELDLAKMGIEV